MATRDHVMRRIRAEYREMPDMRLRLEQVQRLCDIERAMCEEALAALVDAKFLRVRADGSYVLGTGEQAASTAPPIAAGIFRRGPESV